MTTQQTIRNLIEECHHPSHSTDGQQVCDQNHIDLTVAMVARLLDETVDLRPEKRAAIFGTAEGIVAQLQACRGEEQL
jgi:hypothetical protein